MPLTKNIDIVILLFFCWKGRMYLKEYLKKVSDIVK